MQSRKDGKHLTAGDISVVAKDRAGEKGNRRFREGLGNSATNLKHSYTGGLMCGRLHAVSRVREVTGFVLQGTLGLC